MPEVERSWVVGRETFPPFDGLGPPILFGTNKASIWRIDIRVGADYSAYRQIRSCLLVTRPSKRRLRFFAVGTVTRGNAMKRFWFTVAAVVVGLSAISAQDYGQARVRQTGAPIVPLQLEDDRTVSASSIEPASIAPMSAQDYAAPTASAGCGGGGCDAATSGPVASGRFLSRLRPTVGIHRPACSDSEGKYGLHPVFKKLLWWRKDCECAQKPRVLGRFGGLLGANSAGLAMARGVPEQGPPPPPGIGYPGTPGAGMPGTLVFPHHSFVRSPRDFFMQDVK